MDVPKLLNLLFWAVLLGILVLLLSAPFMLSFERKQRCVDFRDYNASQCQNVAQVCKQKCLVEAIPDEQPA